MFVAPSGTSPLVIIDFGLSLFVGDAKGYQSKWSVGSMLYVRQLLNHMNNLCTTSAWLHCQMPTAGMSLEANEACDSPDKTWLSELVDACQVSVTCVS